MDYPLGGSDGEARLQRLLSLNPYSNGLPSRGRITLSVVLTSEVLIPILMDYPLGATRWY